MPKPRGTPWQLHNSELSRTTKQEIQDDGEEALEDGQIDRKLEELMKHGDDMRAKVVHNSISYQDLT